MSAAKHDPLIAYGFTPEQSDALHALWDTELVKPLLNYSAHTLRERGVGAAETYDAIRHVIDPNDAALYVENGFTAHQAHLVEHTPSAAAIANAQDVDAFEEFMGGNAPPDFLVNVLLIAKSRADAKTYLDRYRAAHDPEVRSAVVGEVAMLAGLQEATNPPTFACECGQGPA